MVERAFKEAKSDNVDHHTIVVILAFSSGMMDECLDPHAQRSPFAQNSMQSRRAKYPQISTYPSNKVSGRVRMRWQCRTRMHYLVCCASLRKPQIR